jgi:hypothetical protein
MMSVHKRVHGEAQQSGLGDGEAPKKGRRGVATITAINQFTFVRELRRGYGNHGGWDLEINLRFSRCIVFHVTARQSSQALGSILAKF